MFSAKLQSNHRIQVTVAFIFENSGMKLAQAPAGRTGVAHERHHWRPSVTAVFVRWRGLADPFDQKRNGPSAGKQLRPSSSYRAGVLLA
jgi:hypothetical protein